MILDQSFHFHFVSNFKEGIKVGLLNIDLSVIDEFQQSLHIRELDALQVDQRVAVVCFRIFLKKGELAAKITLCAST